MEVGYGHMDVKRVREILDSKDRSLAPEAAEARGLFLQEVYYS